MAGDVERGRIMMLGVGVGVGLGVSGRRGSSFTMNAGNWPGTLTMRRQTVTPASPSLGFTAAAWVRAGADGTMMQVLHAANSTGTERFYLRRNTDNTMAIRLVDPSGTELITRRDSTGTITVAGGWQCVMVSADMFSFNKVLMYIGDTQEVNTTFSVVSPIFYDTGGLYRWGIGGTYGNATQWTGDLGNVVFHDSAYLDLTVEANRRKLMDALGKPVDLGADGSTPLGSQPYIYMGNPGTYADWNAGTTLNLGSLDAGAAWSKQGSGSITSATPP